MNLQIINDCAGTDPGLPTAGTDPGRRFNLRVPFSVCRNRMIIIQVHRKS